jgi:hypothetical protein
MDSLKVHLRCTDGETLNHVFPIQYDLNGYWLAVTQLEGNVRLSDTKIHPAKTKYPKSPLYLCCDVVEESYMAGQDGRRPLKLPIIMELPSIIGNMDIFIADFLWYKITHPFFSDSKLYIVDETGNIPSFEKCDIRCSFLLARKKGW